MSDASIRPYVYCALAILLIAFSDITEAQRGRSKEELKIGQIVKTADRATSSFWDNATVLKVDGDRVTLRVEGFRKEIVERPKSQIKTFYTFRERQLISYKDFFGKGYRGTVMKDDGGDKVEVRARGKTQMVERKYISTRATQIPMAEDAEAIAKGEVSTESAGDGPADRAQARLRERMSRHSQGKNSNRDLEKSVEQRMAEATASAMETAKKMQKDFEASASETKDSSSRDSDEPKGPPDRNVTAPEETRVFSASSSVSLEPPTLKPIELKAVDKSKVLESKIVVLPTTRSDSDLEWARRTSDDGFLMLGYHGLGEVNSEFYRIDTTTGEIVSAVKFPEGQFLLDVSPDGSLAMLRSAGFRFGDTNRIYFYEILPTTLQGSISFTPKDSGFGGGSSADIKSGQFIDNENVLIETRDEVAMWRLGQRRPSAKWNVPRVNGYYSIASTKDMAHFVHRNGLALVSVPEGKVLQTLEADKLSHISPYSRFTSDNRYLVNSFERWINVWDLVSPGKPKAIKLQPKTYGPAQRVNDTYYLLFGNGRQCRVFDADLGVVVYEYEYRHRYGDGQVLDADEDRLWFSWDRVVGWIPTPIEEWKKATDQIKQQDISALHKGDKVKIEYDIAGRNSREFQAAAEKAVRDAGLVIDPSADLRFLLETKQLKPMKYTATVGRVGTASYKKVVIDQIPLSHRYAVIKGDQTLYETNAIWSPFMKRYRFSVLETASQVIEDDKTASYDFYNSMSIDMNARKPVDVIVTPKVNISTLVGN